MTLKLFSFLLLWGFTSTILAQDIPTFKNYDGVQTILEDFDTVFTEEMTWIEVRNALKDGKNTIIIGTGGVEQNGPYAVTGRHNYILRATTEAIARKLGDALVAPIVPFVPEGKINPPSDHMLFPGTVSVREQTFKRLLIDIASSYKTHGFKHIVFIGDSGGNQKGMKKVAEKLHSQWKNSGVTVSYIPEYYTWHPANPDNGWLSQFGIIETDEGLHDNYCVTAMLCAINPELNRIKQRIKKEKASINGVPLIPMEKTIDIGTKAIQYLSDITVKAILRRADTTR